MALTKLQREILKEVISKMSDINQFERLLREAIRKRKIESATVKSLWAVLPSAVKGAFKKKMLNRFVLEKHHSMSSSEQAIVDAWTHQHFHSHRTD